MNVVCITGRVVKDAEIKNSGDNFSVANVTLAVQRDFPDKSGKFGVDYIECVIFGKTVEFAEKYCKKGVKFEVLGKLRQDRWQTKEGQWRSKTSVTVDSIRFAETIASSKRATKGQDNSGVTINDSVVSDFMDVGAYDDEVPFI